METDIAEMSLKISALMKELADISDDLDDAGCAEAAKILDDAYVMMRKARFSIRKGVE